MAHAPPAPLDSDARFVELVRQAQAGCNAAAQAVFDRYRQPLLAVIRAAIVPRLRTIYDSDDFLADTFAAIFAHQFSDNLLRSPDSLWRYLRTIAENIVRDARRRHLLYQRRNLLREVSLCDLQAADQPACRDLSPFEALVLKELVEERMRDLVQQLPELLQRIIEAILKGRSTPEIAAELEVEPKRVHRAMEWLKKKITSA